VIARLDSIVDLRRVLGALATFSGCINLLLLVPAVYMLQVYDRVLTSRNEGTLLALSVLLVALLGVEAALDRVRSRVLGRVGTQLDEKFDAPVFDAAYRRAAEGHVEAPAQAFTDLGRLREFVAGKGLVALLDVPWMPLFLLVIYLLHPVLGTFALAAALALVALAWYNQRSAGPLMQQAGQLSAATQNEALAQLRNIEVIAALGMQGSLRDRWLKRQQGLLAVSERLGDRSAGIGSLSRYTRLTLQSGILGLGAYLVLHEEMSAGGIIAASVLLGRALAPVDLLITQWKGIAAAREAWTRVSGLLAAYPTQRPGVQLPRPRGDLRVEGLVVAAPGKREPILRNLSFSVAPGTLVGVVGPSASGKSTLGRALLGIWKPLAGSVRLDGAALHIWDREQVGRWLGYLPQDVELFDGSVAENIARCGEIDSGKVIDAARRAGVHEMVLQMPQGYDTRIGAGGLVLSGGQRQRIGLARALYGDPVMIVLDEPNSSLDEAGDAALLAALKNLRAEGRTAFIISHRLNVLSVVDQVLVLAGGTLRIMGPRTEVMQAARAARNAGADAGSADQVVAATASVRAVQA
jgi:ATP-binding cassette subfamily C exporter for protease/lipase